jgi:hypothetical protein
LLKSQANKEFGETLEVQVRQPARRLQIRGTIFLF